jgi:predicted glycoside hydrolase/deacetylase ChbG (UPF0249 family)
MNGTLIPARSIAICADDFGMNDSVDDGILELAAMRRLSAVSVLTQGPSIDHRAAELATLDVDLGVHLNFTEALGQSGLFMAIGPLVARSYTSGLDRSAITAQIERQLDAFEARFGRAPNYVDGHQHVHQLPRIREALLATLGRRYGPQAPWIRITTPGDLRHVPAGARVKAHIIAGLGSMAFARAVARAGLSRNRRFLGVYDFTGGEDGYSTLMQGWLDGAQAGDLMMCHPAKSISDATPMARQRVAEFQVLSSAAMGEWLGGRHLRIARLSRLSGDRERALRVADERLDRRG